MHRIERKKRDLLLIIFLIFLFIGLSGRLYAKMIKNDDPFFILTIPDNFEPLSGNQVPKDWDAGYRERTGLEDKQPISIGIDIIDGLLEQGYRIDIDQLVKEYPEGAIIEKHIFRALGFDLEGVKISFDSGPVKSIMYLGQVPVRPNSIGIIIGGTEERKDEIMEIFGTVAGSIEADTNWKQPGQRKKSRFYFLGIGLLCIPLLFKGFRRLIGEII